jgi:hypothetical protein
MSDQTQAQVPRWTVEGDWFDVCRCTIPCPCEFAQAPTDNYCQGVLAWHINRGTFGEVKLDGLNVLALGAFTGNLWDGKTKATMGIYMDERADLQQRDALQTIFGGRGGGFPAMFASLIGELRGIEFAAIEFELASDLSTWRARVPGRVEASATALTGPMTPPGKRVQTINPPGSEVGPGTVATWGVATADKVDAMGFSWEWGGRSSKHIPFSWNGPDAA